MEVTPPQAEDNRLLEPVGVLVDEKIAAGSKMRDHAVSGRFTNEGVYGGVTTLRARTGPTGGKSGKRTEERSREDTREIHPRESREGGHPTQQMEG